MGDARAPITHEGSAPIDRRPIPSDPGDGGDVENSMGLPSAIVHTPEWRDTLDQPKTTQESVISGADEGLVWLSPITPG
jgi:hypothetical protein